MSLKRILAALVMIVMLFVGLIPSSMAANGIKVFYMGGYNEGDDIYVMWYNNIEGAHHYDCTILNQTTGVYVRQRSTSSTGYDASVSGSRATAGSYKVWVGAVDTNGNVIDEGYAYFTITASACEHKWSSRTGTCKLCDEECPHNNGVYTIETKMTHRSISSTKHEVTSYYDEQCKVCRYTLAEDQVETYTERHVFDGNGDCTLCNYRKECTHSNYDYVINFQVCKPIDDNEHYHDTQYDKVCANPSCGKLLQSFVDEKREYYEENHTFNSSMVCTHCGYKKTVEPLTVTINKGQSAANVGDTISASANASGGVGTYTYYWTVYCDGSSVTSGNGSRYSYVPTKAGSYTFNVIVRDQAGNEVSKTTAAINVVVPECVHSNHSYTEKEVKTESYSKYSSLKHYRNVQYAKVCDACGETYNTYVKAVLEDHKYVNGVCACGLSPTPTPAPSATPCPHSYILTEISKVVTKTGNYDTHAVTAVYAKSCTKCGAKFANEEKNTTENHTLNSNGICTVCGYIQVEALDDHTDKKVVYTSPYQYQFYDADQHVKTRTYDEICNVCGIAVRTGVVTKPRYENHTLDGNGVCTKCLVSPHVHQYQRVVVSTGKLVNVSLSIHTVEITYYEVCSCGEKTANKTETVQEAHNYSDKNHIEVQHTANGHHMFDRCSCGAVQYTTYAKYNQCCSCGYHKWSAPYDENGKWLEKCNECKITRESSVHRHGYNVTIIASKQHPHQVTGYCSCGDAQVIAQSSYQNDCCECVGHIWEESLYGGYVESFCLRCGVKERKKTNGSQAWKEFCDLRSDTRSDVTEYNTMSSQELIADSAWRAIAYQATDKLADGGFIFGVEEYVHALANQSETVGKFVDKKLFGKDELTEQETAIWLNLIVEMLAQDELERNTSGSTFLEVYEDCWNTVDTFVIKSKDRFKKAVSIDAGKVEKLNKELGELEAKFNEQLKMMTNSSDPGYSSLLGESVDNYNNIQKTSEQLKEAQEQLKTSEKGKILADALPWVFNAAISIMKGCEAADEARILQETYGKLAVNYEENVRALQCLIEDANAMSNSTLESAAREVLRQIDEEYSARVGTLLDTIGEWCADENKVIEAFGTTAGMSFIAGAADIGLDALGGPFLSIVSAGATLLEGLSNYDEVYQSAEKLMVLGTMSAKMNLYSATDKNNDTDYIYRLWAKLQVEGCDQAKDFLSQYSSNTITLNARLKELGLDANTRTRTYSILNAEKRQYQSFFDHRKD